MSIKLYNNTILLNDNICCDGFYKEDTIRIQSHFHADHMSGFSRSTQLQKIIMTPQTKELIKVSKNLPSIDSRSNIFEVDYLTMLKLENYKIRLLDSSHMLGSAQVEVELKDGYRVGYSGDFNMPLSEVIQVDELFVDGTYQDPNAVMAEPLENVKSQFCEIIRENINDKHFLIWSHSGTLLNAASTINDNFPDLPFLVSKKLKNEMDVYNKFGYSFTNYFSSTDKNYYDIIDSNRYVKLKVKPEHHGGFPKNCIGFELWAKYGRNRGITTISSNHYNVSFSDHADFNSTLDYIAETKAKKVYTDIKRDPVKAAEFARIISSKLKIKAQPVEKINNSLL